jgi:dipeptidyl aminopeptidase/acylaminoacyl peptidase
MMGPGFRWILFGWACLSAQAGAAPRVESGALTFDDIPDAAPAFVAALAPYLDARGAAVLCWTPTGQLLIRTRLGEVPQLHLVEQALGARRQLSFGADPVGLAACSPNILHPGVAFVRAAAGGDELWYQGLAGGAERLLAGGGAAIGAPLWSSSGKELAFSSNARDPGSSDILIVNPESGALPHLALAGDGPTVTWRALDWSPDDRQLLLLKTVGPDDGHLFILDLETGQKREIEGGVSRNRIADARFGRDAQGVYYLSDRDGEFLALRYVNLYNGQRQLLSDRNAADVSEFALSPDGQYLAYVRCQAEGAALEIVDLRTHQDLIPPHLPAQGTVDSLHFDLTGKRLAFTHSSVQRARDAYVLDVAANRLDGWTASEVGRADPQGFNAPRNLPIPTFDRNGGRPRDMPVRLFEPKAAGRHPVLIMFCTGDEGEEDADCPRAGAFDPWMQYLTGTLGFAVIEPALRGGSGHGKSFRALGAGALREDAVKDIGAVLVWLRGQPQFDPARVFVAGRGFGGSLALAALFNYGDRLRGGIAFDAIGDFVSFLGDTTPRLAAMRRAEYGDERDPGMRALLRRLAPLNNVDRINKPVLIVQADADPRIPGMQSEQLVNSLRSRGVGVWYLRAALEGAPMQRKHDEDVYRLSVAQFLDSLR